MTIPTTNGREAPTMDGTAAPPNYRRVETAAQIETHHGAWYFVDAFESAHDCRFLVIKHGQERASDGVIEVSGDALIVAHESIAALTAAIHAGRRVLDRFAVERWAHGPHVGVNVPHGLIDHVSPAALRTYVAIAEVATDGPHRLARVSYDTLTGRTGHNRRTVRDAVTRLIDVGALIVRERGSTCWPTLYELPPWTPPGEPPTTTERNES